ncbi:C2 and gram domain-containing protein at1g03370-like protein, partial [Trifolium pratense]
MSVFVLTAMDFAVLGFLVPSLWEIEVAFAASVFVILAYWFFTFRSGDHCSDRSLDNSSAVHASDDKIGQSRGDSQSSAYLIKLELLAAKNLIAANLNGTSDPYVIITCGNEKRFRIMVFPFMNIAIIVCTSSSMVPGSRNPMWGEEFNFSVDELPVQKPICCPGAGTVPVSGTGTGTG